MKAIFATLFAFFALCVSAQNYSDYFTDATLRLDYVFSGNHDQQTICIDGLSKLPQWAGRRSHLSEIPVLGYGTLVVRSKASGEVIYKTSFSSLFQEWLETPEAKTTSRAMQQVVLVPYPKNEVEITIDLRSNRREVAAQFTHTVNPADILIRDHSRDELAPHRYLVRSGDPAKCIDVAIIAEGYTKDEMTLFYADAQKATDAIFSHEPFASNKDKFNIVAVATASHDSDVSVPQDGIWRNTACNSNFSTFYMTRYLTTNSMHQVHNLIAGIPYEHVIILANTDTYGGGGIYNSYVLTTTHHEKYNYVVVHEFGHAFCGLADEYFYPNEPSDLYPLDVEPWEPNITTLVDFDSKWKDMLDAKTAIPTTKEPTKEPDVYEKIGVYEGGGYCTKGVYRPVVWCRMRNNEAPGFCPVCRRALSRAIDFYTKD